MLKTWTPEDKETVRTMVAAGRSIRDIAAAFKVSPNSIHGVVARNNLGPWPAGTRGGNKPIPDGLARAWPGASLRQLGHMFTDRPDRVREWGKQLGLPPKLTNKAKAAAGVSVWKKKPLSKSWAQRAQPVCIDQPFRDDSPAGQAARVLQSLGLIYRCLETGTPSIRGKFWNRGGKVLTDADVIERATSYQQREARRLAA